MPRFKTLAGAQKRAAFEQANSNYVYLVEKQGDAYFVRRTTGRKAPPAPVDLAQWEPCDWNATGATRLHDGKWYRNREHLPHLIRSDW